MDSGNNSGSMKTSSTGDEEYHSRAKSNPNIFLNPNSIGTAHFVGSSESHHRSQNQQQPTLLFDHLSTNNNYLQQALFTANSSTQPQPISNPNFFLNQERSYITAANNVGSRSEPKTSTTSQFVGPSSSVRSSKKRTRASRRAPTTVLTTDTSNFRAMVQEFTGIPPPPFSSGGYPTSFSRCRLDLFGGAGIVPDHCYPLRPLAQKPKTSSFLSSSNSPLFGNSATKVDIPNSSSTFPTSCSRTPSIGNYHTSISDQDDHNNQPRNNALNMQNPITAFQSTFNPHDYHLINPSFNVPGFGTNPQGNLAMMISANTIHEDLNAEQGYCGQDGTTSYLGRRQGLQTKLCGCSGYVI